MTQSAFGGSSMSGPSRSTPPAGAAPSGAGAGHSGPGDFGATTLSGGNSPGTSARGGATFRSGTATAPGTAPGMAPNPPSGSAANRNLGTAPTTATRTTRPRGPRRARLQLRNVSPLTVLKFSSVLSIALFFVWLILVGVLYGVLDAAGVIGHVNDTIQTINGNNGKPLITPKIVFGGAAIIGAVNMVLFVALSTIGSVIYNLCADLVGGVEITLSER